MKLLVYPTPPEAGSLRVWLYRMPTDLAINGSADASELTLPPGWDDLVADFAEYRAKRKDRDQDWQGAKQIYEDNLADLKETAEQWADQAGLVVTGSGSYPAWLVGGSGWDY